ncbi:MAG: hypothetical protein RRY95_04410 [Oscillospiraceae bacterium]
MLWLWILGGLSALVALLCLTRVGCTVRLDKTLTLDIKIGLLHMHIDPNQPQKPKPATEAAPPKAKKELSLDDLKSKLPKVTRADVKTAWEVLLPVGRDALRRTRRGLRIDPLQLSVTLGDRDPAALAQHYGLANALLWTAMPQLEQLLVIPDPAIHLGMDFGSEKTELRGEIGLSARIGTLLFIGLRAGLPTLRWFLALQKTKNAEKQAAGEVPVTPDAAQ